MVLNFKNKKNIINKFKQISMNAISAFIMDFSGITANQMTELRKLSRESNIQLYIVRNRLMQRAVKGTSLECLKDKFIGPNIIAFSKENVNTSARLLTSFSKKNTNLKIKMAVLEGNLIQDSQIESLVNMPNYKESVIFLVSTIKNISITKLFRTLIAVCNKKEKYNI
ncbi:50S ribosomal protein L10 [secondary endosymbiont of Trabutina mannipara]|uniref:Large ribosomal subunit protein uL10 n=1 Tax=secondary endosymbiont of Trabutina mannipara TaxID=1835721 RepID=A0A1C3L4B4_9ENTR|nr:50S ribosomal protein L10 [secondary endosymbiont of Trabutina mannipara]SBT82117.1 50S ribosomal protein L10 [secondary endosymbiont of Trabutina mannipara]